MESCSGITTLAVELVEGVPVYVRMTQIGLTKAFIGQACGDVVGPGM